MRHHPVRYARLAAVALTLACGAAVAAPGISASAAISHVQLGVIDLTPNDGHAAGYSAYRFLDEQASGLSLPDDHVNLFHPDYMSNSPKHTGVAYGASYAQTSSNGAIGEMQTAAYLNAAYGPSGQLSASGTSQQRLWVTLQPHTAFYVSGHYDLSLADTGNPDKYYYGGAGVQVALLVNQDKTRSSDSIFLQDGRRNASDDFWVGYANTSDRESEVLLDFSISANAYAWAPAIPPVPEPDSYLMLGAGLLLLGAVGRRRAAVRAVRRGVLGLGLVLACGASFAAATSSASFSGLQLSVIDLTPGDGQAAGFLTGLQHSTLDASVWSRSLPNDDWDIVSDQRSAAGLVASTVNASQSGATAHGSSNGLLGDVSTTSTLPNTPTPSGLTAQGNSTQTVEIVIKPHSVLVLQGQLLLTANQQADPSHIYNLHADAYIHINNEELQFSRFVDSSLSNPNASNAMNFWVAYSNTGSSDKLALLDFHVSTYSRAWASVPPQPVPEPASYAMLGAGLALVAALRRKRPAAT